MSRRSGLRAADIVVVVGAVVADLIPWGADRELGIGGELPLPVIPVVVVLVYGTLPLRHRHWWGVFWLQWGIAFASLLVPQFQPFAGLLVALYAVARLEPSRWRAVGALAVTILPLGVHSYQGADLDDPDPLGNVALLLAVWMLLAVATWGAGRVAHQASRRAWRLRLLQHAEAEASLRAERHRIARELHDTVTHGITAMIIQAAAAQAALTEPDDATRVPLRHIEQAGAHAMTELHRVLQLLRAVDDPSADGSDLRPTLADVTTLVEMAADTGLDVRLTVLGVPAPVSPAVQEVGYRIIQEALTNALKHAGRRAPTTIVQRWTGRTLALAVETTSLVWGRDDGAAERPGVTSGGWGLVGLRERVAGVGGSVHGAATPTGFVVEALLPLDETRLSSSAEPAARAGDQAAAGGGVAEGESSRASNGSR